MSDYEWDTWYDGKATDNCSVFPGCRIRIRRQLEGSWIHVLVSPLDEPNPRQNHVHIKAYNTLDGTHILCGITEDGRKSHSRKKLLDRINEVTGLNLQYR